MKKYGIAWLLLTLAFTFQTAPIGWLWPAPIMSSDDPFSITETESAKAAEVRALHDPVLWTIFVIMSSGASTVILGFIRVDATPYIIDQPHGIS